MSSQSNLTDIEHGTCFYNIYQHARNIYCMINGHDVEER
jgi:hypothetical protein